jgi:hypothetical protein
MGCYPDPHKLLVGPATFESAEPISNRVMRPL